MPLQIISDLHIQKPAEILQHPNKNLRKVCSKVAKFDDETKKIARDLIAVLKEVDSRSRPWLGMAANQIGYDKRVIAIKNGLQDYTVMVNPELLERKWSFYTVSACFSLKGLYLLKRFFWHRVRYQDTDGNYHEVVIKGGKSTVFQQEIEHIEGKLISD